MSQRDRERLSSLGGKAKARKYPRLATPVTVRIARSAMSSRRNGRTNTAMQRVRIAHPRAWCQAAYKLEQRGFIVIEGGHELGFGKTPRSAWEQALTTALADAVSA